MKVLYFHQYFSTPDGAVGTRSFEMASRLVREGHDVLVVCATTQRAVTGLSGPFVAGVRRGFVQGIEVLEFDQPYSNHHGLLRRAATFVRFALSGVRVAMQEPYDVLIASSTPLTAALPGIAARWLRAKPFVFEVRDLWPELPRAMGVIRNPVVLLAMTLLEWLGYRSATSLIGLAPGIVDGIAQRGVPRHRIAMIPNGCDLALFGETGARVRPAPCGADELVAVFAGAHSDANGLEAVVDAAEELARRGRTDIRLLLIGEGRRKLMLQDRVRTLGLTNVTFLDSIEKRSLATLLASCDLGLQILANVPAFYRGTSPNKFFDYLAAGVPVLINYPGWLAELVESQGCGYAVTPDNPRAFADALEHAADHRELIPQMGARARTLAAEMFSRDVLSLEFVRVIEHAAR